MTGGDDVTKSVSKWLDGLGLLEYFDVFKENRIDWEILTDLTADDLKEIGVKAVGDRRRLLKAIDEIRETASSEAIALAPNLSAAASQTRNDQAASSPPETSLRQVTVLFADLVGFTSLTSQMDAEDVHVLLNQYFDVVDAAVVRYGGRIDKHIGDAVMAVFGAPVAHTNDPERALHAALEIHKVVARLDPPLTAHVGVASGQVIASTTGSDAHAEYTVTGDGVNLASRLTDMAGSGETLASSAVRHAVGDLFHTASRGEHVVKGLTEPIEVWRIDGLADAAALGEDRIFGRNDELSRLAGELDACRTSGKGRVIVLQGEPGIGKTRLLTELGRLPEASAFQRLRCTVLDFGVAAERAPLHTLARGLLGLAPDATFNARAKAAETAVAAGRVDPAYLPHLSNLLDLSLSADQAETFGAMDHLERTNGRRAVLKGLIGSACHEQPLLVEFEDVHWAAPQDLADLGELAHAIQGLPATIAMTTRRAENPLDADWVALLENTPLITLDLAPLPADDALELAVAQRSIDPTLLDSCIARAGGNPLFLRQLLLNADHLRTDTLPDSIFGIVQARLDAMASDDRTMLQAAAVLGQRFTTGALQHLLDDPAADLSRFLSEALLREDGPELMFAHALICDGAYASLLRSQRISLHRRAAAWFKDRDLALHARHLDRASAPEAEAAYLAAARQFTKNSEYDRALPLLERAIELENTGHRFDIQCALGEVLRALGESDRALMIFAEAAASTDDDARSVRAHIGLAQVARQVSRYEQALASLDVAQEAAERLRQDGDLARIHYLRGNLYFPLGRIDDILASTERAMVYAEKMGLNHIQVGGFSNFGDANYMKGAMRSAAGFYTKAIDLAREHKLNRDLAANLHNRGAARLYLCELGLAKADAEEALALARQHFVPVAECVALASLAAAVLVEGKADLAMRLNEEGIKLAQGIGAKRFEAQARGYVTRILFLQGQTREAQIFGRSGMELALSVARNFTGPKELSAYALTLTDTEDQDLLLARGAEILAEGCVSHCHFFFYSDAIRIMLTRGDWDGTLKYADALAEFTRAEPLPLADLTIQQAQLFAELGRHGLTKALTKGIEDLRSSMFSYGIEQTLSGLRDTLPNKSVAE